MSNGITSAMLEDWKSLLREGRVQECDNQINAAEEGLKRAELEAKMSKPAGEPPTDEELELAFKTELCALQGNPPRLLALLVEIRGRAEKTE
jgi:hypothetical protein